MISKNNNSVFADSAKEFNKLINYSEKCLIFSELWHIIISADEALYLLYRKLNESYLIR